MCCPKINVVNMSDYCHFEKNPKGKDSAATVEFCTASFVQGQNRFVILL